MANDFSGDSNCVALWNFESGALTTDSKGSNTLTDNNTVGTNTTDYKQGSACADFEWGNNEYFNITDANLDSGFPLKNGDTTKEISVCFWFKLESQDNGDSYPFTKGKAPDNDASFAISFEVTSGPFLEIFIGYNSGSNFEVIDVSSLSFSTGQWYHLGVTFKDSTKAWTARLWDDTGESASSASGTSTNNINVEAGDLRIGAIGTTPEFDGLMDEMVVFKDILSNDEIDQIRSGTFGSAGRTTKNTDSHPLGVSSGTSFRMVG